MANDSLCKMVRFSKVVNNQNVRVETAGDFKATVDFKVDGAMNETVQFCLHEHPEYKTNFTASFANTVLGEVISAYQRNGLWTSVAPTDVRADVSPLKKIWWFWVDIEKYKSNVLVNSQGEDVDLRCYTEANKKTDEGWLSYSVGANLYMNCEDVPIVGSSIK